jgi:hypothetical protein
VPNVKFSALPVAPTVLPADTFAIVQGGASKQSSLANLWEATPVGNAAYTILPTDVMVYTSVAFTLPRIWTLPSAASYGPGRVLRIVDSIGTLTSTNTLTIQRAGSDLIGGAASQVLSSARGAILLVSDGNTSWTVIAFTVAGGLSGGNSYQALTLTAAGNTNSNQSASEHFLNVNVNAGAGIYTATISLPTAGRAAGDAINVYLNVAASTNPKVQIFNNTPAGTKLFEWNGDGTVTNIALVCVFTGALWYLHDAHFFA